MINCRCRWMTTSNFKKYDSLIMCRDRYLVNLQMNEKNTSDVCSINCDIVFVTHRYSIVYKSKSYLIWTQWRISYVSSSNSNSKSTTFISWASRPKCPRSSFLEYYQAIMINRIIVSLSRIRYCNIDKSKSTTRDPLLFFARLLFYSHSITYKSFFLQWAINDDHFLN
jgi:hypothetical protein